MARQHDARHRSAAAQDQMVRLAGVVRRSRRGLLLGTALQATVALVLLLPARAQLAPNARPVGGVVVGGAASISRTPGATNIDQSTQRAAVNWQSFDVGSKQAVNFQQPNATAVVLNRVTGPNPSQIAGQINANGQVIIENQDGITFLKGAQINTAGLVATAAGITNKNFMAGHMVFDQPAAANAAVVNEGHITVRQAGIAALVAPQVANSGVIVAKLGRVVLAGASTATVDLYGDGLVSIDVNGEVRRVPVGPDGKPVTALVTNTGTILAAGGEVLLTARQAAGLVQNLVVAGGTIAAPTAMTPTGARTGQIVLNGIGGSLVVAGALLARGNRAGETGGQIEVAPSGGVSLASTARIDASGAAGGGTVAIGTDLARASGGPSVTPTLLSHDVTVAKGAVIAANATAKGNGGRVTVLSAASTVMHGTIAARGGPRGGDGGFVEVSGQTLGFDGMVDVGAPAGNLGSILFDPGTLDIVSGSIGSGSLDATVSVGGVIAFNTGTTTASDTTSLDTVTSNAINSIGSTGNVILQAATLLDVQAGVSVTNGLTLQSGGNLLVDAGITVQAGSTLSLGSGIDFASGHAINAGSIALGTALGSAATLIAPSVILDAGTGGVALNNAAIHAGSGFDVSAAGSGVAQAAAGAITTPILQSTHGVTGAVALNGANTIAAIGSLVVTGGDFAMRDAGASVLTVTGSLVANNVTLAGATGLVLPGTIRAPGGIVDLSTGAGGIRQPGSGVVAAGILQSSGTIGGAVTLAGTANAIAALGALPLATPTTSDFFLVDTGLLNAGAALAADHLSLNAGTIDVTGSLAGAAQVLLSAGAVTLGAGGTLAAPLVGLRADTIIAAAGSIQSVSTLEVAPATSGGTITLNGPASSSLDLDALLGAGESLLRIGAVTPAGGSAATIVAGSIAVGGSFGTSTVNLELDASGPITEGTSGTLTAATLTGLVNAGSVALNGANAVGTLGAFGVTGGDFSLAESAGRTLTVGGSVSAAGHRLALGADGLAFGSAGSLVAATVALAPVSSGTTVTLGSGGAAFDVPASAFAQINAGRVDIGSLDGGAHVAAGAISITAAISVGSGTTLGLYANGTIVEPGGSLLTAGLVGYAGLGADLTAGNSIPAIGSFGIGAGHTLALNDVAADVALNANNGFQNLVFTDPGGTVTVAGALSGQNITIDPTVIDVASAMSVAAGGTIALDAGTIGTPGTIILASTSTLLAAGASVELSTVGPGGGGVTQASGGTIVAGTLFSAGGVSGGVDLLGSNTIAVLGSFAVPDGDFVLADGGETGALTLASTLSANNVTLGGAIGAPGSIVLNGGTIALNSGGTAVILGAGAGGITLAGTALVNAGATGTVALGAGAGGITQSTSAAIVTGTLRGEGTVGGAVALGGANTIATLGSFTVSGADFTLADGGQTGTLRIAGPVSAVDVTIGGGGTLSPTALSVTGDITTTGSLMSLAAGSGGLTIGGSLNATGTLALGATGGGVAETGTIVAGTLASLGTVVGGAGLTGSNTIGAIGNFTVSGGDFALADAGEAAGTLAVPGTLVANDVTIGAGGTAPGAIAITGTVGVNGAPGTVALIAGSGGIALDGSGLLGYGPGGLGTVDLTTAGGGITEAGSARLSAATLQSTGGVVGTVDLAGTTNAIGQIDNFVVSGGDLTLIEQANQPLTVAGSVSAAGHRIGLGTDGLVMGGSGSLVAATVAIAPVSSTGTLVTLGSTGSGLVLSAADFAQINAGTIDIGQLASGATIASAISITSAITIPGTTTLGLFAAGGVVEVGGSIVGGGGLMGQAGSFALAGGNTIAALGPIVSAQGFGLNDNGALDVVGAIQGGSVGTAGAVAIVDAGALSLDAGITATVGSAVTTGVSLVATGTGNGIAQNSGTIATDGAIILTAAGSVQQTGTSAAILAQIGTSGLGGTIGLFGTTGITLAGSVAAAANNVFVQAGTGGGVTLAATGTLSAGGAGSQLLVQGDTLTVAAGAALLATGGTVAIAPASAIETSFGSTTPGLQLGPTVVGAISAAELRVGGYFDQSGANQVTASGISLDQSVALTGHAATLRLDANGTIAQTAGSLTVGTLSVSSNGAAAGAITLNALGNDVTSLGNVTVGSGDGDFTLNDAAGTLTLPATSTVYADNVTISNTGSIVIAGNLAAANGTLSVITTTAGDIVVEAPALIGAATGATFGATGAFTQTGGVIDAQDIGIAANNGDVTQSGGTIFATAFHPMPGGLSVRGSGGLTQSGGAVLASDGTLSINMPGSVSLAGSVLAAGPATVDAGTSLTSSGLVAAEGTLSLTGTGSLSQTGGTIASGAALTLASSGAVSQTGGTADGASVSLSGASIAGGFQSFGGALGVTAGANTTAAITTGAVTPGAAAGTAGSLTLPALATGGPGTLNHLLVDIKDAANPAAGSYSFTAPLVANWVELHTSGALTEGVGGTIVATLFSGSAGMAGPGFTTAWTNLGSTVVSNASFTNANSIADFGPFTATGHVHLTDGPGAALTVVGAVQAGAGGGGHGLALTADSLTVDASGTPVTVYAGQTIASAGSLVADAASAGGTILPGRIQLVTDNLALIPGGIVLVSAPDGSVAIVPRSAGVIALGGVSSAGTLGLSNATLNDITTFGTTTGPAGTETLLIGSLDGATPAVNTIDINSGIVLGTVARTLDLVASGSVVETGGSLSVTALVGTSAAFVLDSGANAIAELGNATARAQGGTLDQTSGFGAQTSLVAGGDLRLNDTASLTVVGPVTAGLSVQPDTLRLSAPSIAIVTAPTLVLATGTIAAAGALLANGSLAGGTLAAGLIALQTDALSIQGTSTLTPIVLAPGGMVAIAPATVGDAMSIDATTGSTTGTLSVATSSLGYVSTFGSISVPGVAPVGAETLVLGSTDGGATQRAGSIAFTAPLDLRSTATTLALFTSGTVSQAIGAGVTVGALVGQAGDAGHATAAMVLTGPNEFTELGGAIGATTALAAPVTLSTDNLGAAGSLIVNVATVLGGGDLLIPAGRTVAAGEQSTARLEIDLAGSLLVAGTVLADNGNVYLHAGNGSIAGDVTIASGGTALAGGAVGSNPTLEVSAGMSYAASGGGFNYSAGTASGSIVIDGVVSALVPGTPASGAVGLYAKNDILEPGPGGTGTLLANVLTGSAGGTAQLLDDPPPGTPSINQIGTLGNFATGNGLVLRDGTSLTVAGLVTDLGPGITLAVVPAGTLVAGYGIGDLAVGGTLSAAAVKLEATGNVYETAGGAILTPSLIAQAGAIPDTESLGQANAPGTVPVAPVARASIWLAGANTIGTLAAVTATNNLLVNDTQNLVLPAGSTVLAGAAAGGITAAGAIPGVSQPTTPTAELDAAGHTLTVAGLLQSGLQGVTSGNVGLNAGTSGAGVVNLTGSALAASGGSVAITAGSSIGITGLIASQTGGGAAGLVHLTSGGAIAETGAIDAAGLTGSSTGATSLTGTNAIGVLGAFAAAGFTFDDGAGVTVTGAVTGGSLALLNDSQSLTVGTTGSVIATTVGLTAPGLTIAGLVSDGGAGTTSLTASNGAIGETGRLISGTLSGSSTGATSLTGSNAIATLGNFSAAGLTVDDGTALTVTGTAAGGSLAVVSDSAGLTVAASGQVSGNAVSLTGASLILAGSVTDGGPGTTSLIATGGAIGETGALVSGTLSGSSTGATSLTGTNTIATLAGFTASGGLNVDDRGNLTVAGPVSAGPSAQITIPGALTLGGPLTAGTVSLAAASLNLDSTLAGTTRVALAIGGAVNETGSLDTPLLTGSSGAATILTSGGNRINEIAGYAAGSVLDVVDGEALTLTGVISAPTMVFDATPNQITIANGTTIVTSGTARPTGPAGSFAYPLSTPTSIASPGAYFSDFVQQGVVTVTSASGGPSIVRIDAYDGGNIALSPIGGLVGTSTWLILDLHGSGALGAASGNMFVRWLDVIFPLGSTGGGAALAGTVDGISGQSAAGASDISPAADARFRVNTCAIGSVNCVVLPVEVLPLANPLQGFSLGSMLNSDEDDDLFLPLVSRRDY
ncbi:MAG: filamentous hemagglutinin N-terminal domain-containing protein [Proteobacteria bacterium]|nr:filamentous hemagglutinin N-terminal domain-containing protein [Pseudomonadota bacterium]